MTISLMMIIAAVLGIVVFQTPLAGIIGSTVIVISAISIFVREIKLYNKIRILERAVAMLCKENSSDTNRD